MKISWEDERSHVLMNPLYSEKEKALFEKIGLEASSLKGHVWLSTSGTSVQKWVGLSKHAFLVGAKTVNHYLESDVSDCWIQCLPFFHVGGLAILARAFLSGAKVEVFRDCVKKKWDPVLFSSFLWEKKGTLLSLVPTQLYDLVKMGYTAPPFLRYLIIGGGALSPALHAKAVALGWPVVSTYGMTETASQVAASKKNQKNLQLNLLPHCEAEVRDQTLFIKSDALLTTYAHLSEETIIFQDPKQEGWFATGDRAIMKNNALELRGRQDHFIKVGGELIDLFKLENLWMNLCIKTESSIESALVPIKNERLENELQLVVMEGSPYEELLTTYNASVLPFERIRKVKIVAALPKTSIGKILKKQL